MRVFFLNFGALFLTDCHNKKIGLLFIFTTRRQSPLMTILNSLPRPLFFDVLKCDWEWYDSSHIFLWLYTFSFTMKLRWNVSFSSRTLSYLIDNPPPPISSNENESVFVIGLFFFKLYIPFDPPNRCLTFLAFLCRTERVCLFKYP